MTIRRRTELKLISAGAITASAGRTSFAQQGVCTRRTSWFFFKFSLVFGERVCFY